ncbi:Beta-galactosidase 17 [Linum perenne]
MARRKRGTHVALLFLLLLALAALCAFIPVFALLPSLSVGTTSSPLKKGDGRAFEIADDKFWKDGNPFQIIGGDLHYFRILPEYWEDRLLKAKALGLNAIQTYVPWNLHEPQPGKLSFEGIADLVSFLRLCQKLDLLVMVRAGPYICGEWDLGGFPPWLLAIEPPLKLRSSDRNYLQLVDKWWGTLLPNNGGPIIMVQIENEFGSYGDDQAYLRHLVRLARRHLGDSIILYTTDGGARENLEKGTIPGDSVFSAVDFTTGDDPWPIFKLQKEFNAAGKSPPLSTEFYTGWLTHWGEKIATTDADFTASSLEKILSRNGSAVLYMAHGGTNFGFYNGANTGTDESDYKPDLTSYDYDAPISESGDVDSSKFIALRKVIERYSASSLPPIPANSVKRGYGPVELHNTGSLFDLLELGKPGNGVESRDPLSMESLGQMFGFTVYITNYSSKDSGNSLYIPGVHDRAQVFTSCGSGNNNRRPNYIGTIERWSNKQLGLPNAKCTSNTSLFILVENLGRINYGKYMYDRKGILSSVYLDGKVLQGWRMISVPLHNLNDVPKANISRVLRTSLLTAARKRAKHKSSKVHTNHFPWNTSVEPTFYAGRFSVEGADQVADTFISFRGWGKGVAFVNDFNIGRYWPSFGPQCGLYVPAPLLKHGENALVILELESLSPELSVQSVDHQDFTCGSRKQNSETLDVL